MSFMLLYNVDYPSNFNKFISIFKAVNPMNSLPDLFSRFSDDRCSDIDSKFLQQDMSCQFFHNCSQSLTMIVIICFYLTFLTIISKLLLRRLKVGFIRKLDRFCRGWTVQKTVFFIFQSFDIDILMSAVVNVKYYAGDSYRESRNLANHLVANWVFWFYPCIIYYFYRETKFATQLIDHRRFYLLRERNFSNWYPLYREVVSLARNYLICLSVVLFYHNPILQMTIALLLLVSTFYLECRYTAFTDKLVTSVQRWLFGLYSACTLVFEFSFFFRDHMEQSTKELAIGLPLIVLFSGIVLANLLPLFVELYTWISGKIKRCKMKKSEDNNFESSEFANLHNSVTLSQVHCRSTNSGFEKSSKIGPTKKYPGLHGSSLLALKRARTNFSQFMNTTLKHQG
jgi:hypothetical protein